MILMISQQIFEYFLVTTMCLIITTIDSSCWSFGTVKWGDIEQFSMFFLNKIDSLNHMAPILQT